MLFFLIVLALAINSVFSQQFHLDGMLVFNKEYIQPLDFNISAPNYGIISNVSYNCQSDNCKVFMLQFESDPNILFCHYNCTGVRIYNAKMSVGRVWTTTDFKTFSVHADDKCDLKFSLDVNYNFEDELEKRIIFYCAFTGVLLFICMIFLIWIFKSRKSNYVVAV